MGAAAAEEYVDEFVGDILRPEWMIQNEDPGRWGIAEKNFLFFTADMNESNIFRKAISGSGDFTLEVVGYGVFGASKRLIFPQWHRYPCLSVGLDFGDERHISTEACTNDARMAKNVGGEYNVITKDWDGVNRFLIRIEKRGFQYDGSIIADGERFDIGSHFMPGAPSSLFLNAWRVEDSVPEAGIFIDRVSITPN